MKEKTSAQKAYESLKHAIRSEKGAKRATELRNSRRGVQIFPDQSVSGNRALRGCAVPKV